MIIESQHHKWNYSINLPALVNNVLEWLTEITLVHWWGNSTKSRGLFFFFCPLQKLSLQNFQSLSWPGISGADGCLSNEVPPSYCNTDLCGTDFTPVCGRKPDPENGDGRGSTDDLSNEALDSGSITSEDLTDNAKEGDTERDVSQLGGELDIEQIERNWAPGSFKWLSWPWK